MKDSELLRYLSNTKYTEVSETLVLNELNWWRDYSWMIVKNKGHVMWVKKQ